MGAIELVSRAVRTPADIATGVLVTPGRVRRLWHELEGTVTQARIVVERAGRAVSRAESDLDDVEALMRRVDGTAEAAGEVVGVAAQLLATAGASTELAGELVARLQRLQDLYEPPLRALAPVLTETAARLRPEQARSVARLLDLVPRVLDQIEPALRNLASLTPELEQVTERVDNVGQIVEGLPGAKLLQRRGRAKENGPAED